ncbi:MAG: BspA family leucine-rich repeat surface protein [Bacteroidales bacterium]
MGNNENLKTAIANVIKTNGNEEITGQVLQTILTSIVTEIGAGATLMGLAVPTTDPSTPDNNVFYFATQAGNYENFNVTIDEGIYVFHNLGGAWNVINIGGVVSDAVKEANEAAQKAEEAAIKAEEAAQKAEDTVAYVDKQVGNPKDLITAHKDNTVSAINEVDNKLTVVAKLLLSDTLAVQNGSTATTIKVNNTTVNIKANELYVDKNVKLTTCNGMFDNSKIVDVLIIPSTKDVTSMYTMFAGCDGLTSLDLRSFDTSKVTTMGEMFSGCSGLTSLYIRSFNTANVIAMNEMFSGCSGLTSLDLSNFNVSNVTNMNYMFDGCTKLTSIKPPRNINVSLYIADTNIAAEELDQFITNFTNIPTVRTFQVGATNFNKLTQAMKDKAAGKNVTIVI